MFKRLQLTRLTASRYLTAHPRRFDWTLHVLFPFSILGHIERALILLVKQGCTPHLRQLPGTHQGSELSAARAWRRLFFSTGVFSRILQREAMVEIWGLHSVAWQAGTGSRLERLNASSMGSLFLARPTRLEFFQRVMIISRSWRSSCRIRGWVVHGHGSGDEL